MAKWISAEEAVALIPDNSSVAFAGFLSTGVPEEIFKQIEKSFLENQTPKNLTVVHAACPSEGNIGLSRLAHDGLVKKIVGSHWGVAPKIGKMISENKIEAYGVSQGQLVLLFREMARKGPGLISKIGLNTFLDPDLEGGKINDLSKQAEGFIKKIQINGEDYLHYLPINLDVAVLRGTSADEKGNITVEDEGVLFENLPIAQAVKANGGKVIVQVKNRVKNGTLNPKNVQIPSIFVDYIVQAKNPIETHRISTGYYVDYSITGGLNLAKNEESFLPLSTRKVIGRRAVCELKGNEIINAGVGIPGDTVGKLINEEGLEDGITSTIESGMYGGIPQGGEDFGLTQNAEAIIEHAAQFDYYNGTGVDVTFMGVAEVDASGNINVSKMNGRMVGCGGFIDITQTAKKVIFCTTFTAGGLEVEINDSGLKIIKEGRVKKFVSKVSQVTFNGPYASEQNTPVLYVTERAVFKLENGQMVLTEIAPGIDLEKDILQQMDFEPVISDDLKEMDLRLFRDEKMGIKNIPYQARVIEKVL